MDGPSSRWAQTVPQSNVARSVGNLSTADVAALDDPSAKAGEANISLNQVSATRIAPAIDTASVGAALETVRLLRSEINAVNATTIAPRMERGSLGQSLREMHADIGIE